MAATTPSAAPDTGNPIPAARPRYKASLSTMWAPKKPPRLSDFLQAARRMGFTQVELNHQVDSAMLKGVDLRQWPLSSLHEPCPADISVEELKARDWLISSLGGESRRHGVEAIKRSIDFAAELGVAVIVVHAGIASADTVPEQKLRQLFAERLTASSEYRELQTYLVDRRQLRAPACLEAAKKSLVELLEYASPFGIRLGLENRYHYYDIPSLDEMGELLAVAEPDRLGFVYDFGHAQALDRLGFYEHEEWLRRYSSRLIEVHLHDVRGVNDHLAPGLGDARFDTVARHLPGDAIRTLELQPANTPEQTMAGLRYLAEHGCIEIIQG